MVRGQTSTAQACEIVAPTTTLIAPGKAHFNTGFAVHRFQVGSRVRVIQIQELFGRQMLIENLSSYLQFEHQEMPEWVFLSVLEKAFRSECRCLSVSGCA